MPEVSVKVNKKGTALKAHRVFRKHFVHRSSLRILILFLFMIKTYHRQFKNQISSYGQSDLKAEGVLFLRPLLYCNLFSKSLTFHIMRNF